MGKEKMKMTYDQWKTEIVNKLIAIGFPKNDARRKSNNYAGFYYDSTHYKDPVEVVNMIMQKGREMYSLREDAIYNWQKQTGLGTDLTYVMRKKTT